jgi:hypothetical protein
MLVQREDFYPSYVTFKSSIGAGDDRSDEVFETELRRTGVRSPARILVVRTQRMVPSRSQNFCRFQWACEGAKCKILTTLMSAFPSSRRVNSWLSFKRLFWAVPGKAGGAAVMTTVDHTLMRGSKPHDR